VRYYFMIRFLPSKANIPLLMGRCISTLHNYISKNKIKDLGVNFPDWSISSIGQVISFIHKDTGTLNDLKKQAYFIDMLDCGFFKISETLIVPSTCQEVRFVRNQSISKLFQGSAKRRLKRLKKRAESQGRSFNPQKTVPPKEVEMFHRVLMSSSSNQQDFIIYIQKENNIEISTPCFNSYGLSTNQLLKGTVPDLSKLVLENNF
jgi:CRISPR-associated endonuclease Csy4